LCGLKERYDSDRSLKLKLDKLATKVRASQHFVVLTGAGISTAAGVPDFRGPKGIWTIEKKMKKEEQKKKRKRPHEEETDSKKEDEVHPSDSSLEGEKEILEASLSEFDKAKPTLTHLAIAKLSKESILKYVITQNVDGLHRRSGLPRNKLAVLHGCVFTEACDSCGVEYFRTFDVGTIGFKKTGRTCSDPNCKGDLKDTVLDWEDPLPEDDYGRSMDECDKSDLVLSLGTSLRIEPAGGLPTRAKQFVVCNLQVTPYDKEAALVIRAKVDDVMAGLLQRLGLPLEN
jgi:mono-ADP-ribosyltransferase sirtuin 6